MKIINDDGKELEFEHYIFYGFKDNNDIQSELSRCSTGEMSLVKSRLECILFDYYLKIKNNKQEE